MEEDANQPLGVLLPRLTSVQRHQGDGITLQTDYGVNATNGNREWERLLDSSTGQHVTTYYAYDTRGRLALIESPVLRLPYAHDASGNVTRMGDQTFGYDALNRLTAASQSSRSYEAAYQYDPVGNRTQLTENGATVGYAYNGVNELMAASGARSASYSYDVRGNLVGRSEGGDTWAYTYDPANRLTQVSRNGTAIATYAYDADGMRVRKTENGVTTTHLPVGHRVLYEVSGGVASKHLWLGEQRLAETRNGKVYFYHNDHLGSARAVTDAAGAVVATSETKPFGEPYPVGGSFAVNHRFTGKEMDGTGLYYYAARYYDPATGRFTTEDSWRGHTWEPWTQHPYVYVGNRPVNYIDPTGHCGVQASSQNTRSCISVALGIVPVVGDVKDVQEVPTGVDLVTGERLSAGARVVTVAAALVPGVSGKLARELVKKIGDATQAPKRLWRAVEPEELADVLKYGDYNIHPNSTFKRFFGSEQELGEFIRRNPNRSYTKTFVDVPENYVNRHMVSHPDLGVGNAYGIDVYEHPEFYKMFEKVNIK